MKRLISPLLIVFIFTSCFSSNKTGLEDNASVNKIFSKKEVANLKQIVSLFDSIILLNSPGENIDISYLNYFASISNSESLDKLWKQVGLANSPAVNSLIINLKKKNAFNDIWIYDYGLDFVTSDTIFIDLAPNLQGKYMRLLELLGKQDKYLDSYTTTIKSFGGIGPSAISMFMKDYYMHVDFNQEVYRLVWAVHYITILSEQEYHE
jgi:hypothetical protein